MLIFPTKKLVVVTPPRTGSTALRAAVEHTDLECIMPYRHMERDGIPAEFRDFTVIGTWRSPLKRLQSLHRYFREVSTSRNPLAPKFWLKRLNADAKKDFEDWLTVSTEPFNDPYDDDGWLRRNYAVKRSYPITRKPQADWYRPDLGAMFVGSVSSVACAIDREVANNLRPVNCTTKRGDPVTGQRTADWLRNWHYADLYVAIQISKSNRPYTGMHKLDFRYYPRYDYLKEIT